jgi:pyruvate kinase
VRRTRIVATIGPASSEEAVVEQLTLAGMNVARLNFSHGDHDSHARDYATIRAVAERLGAPVAVLADLQGPKIRVGEIAEGRAGLTTGGEVTLTSREVVGGPTLIPTTYEALPRDVAPGHRILLADGTLELEVLATDGVDVRCRVTVGGELGSHKGINLPGVPLSTPALTAKDRDDLAFALGLGVDYVALSFVRRPEDVTEIRDAIAAAGSDVPVIVKIEKPECVAALGEILPITDGVMIARGDLGVELPLEDVPILQKRIIVQAHERAVPVITATQMLVSMVDNPRPTRAEASDVANAIFDNTDALMLSEETAAGNFPIEAVRVMDRIARAAEAAQASGPEAIRAFHHSDDIVADTIADAACRAASDIDARGIVVFSRSGRTARLLSLYRPTHPVVGVTPDVRSWRRMALYWGVTPELRREFLSGQEMVDAVDDVARTLLGASPGDRIVVTSGSALVDASVTNALRVQTVSNRDFRRG